MFRHYLFVGLRNFRRHKLYSLINVAGLSIALACALLIILFVRDEISYDKWIPDTENLYRAELTWHFPGRPPASMARSPFPLAPAMLAEIPEVEAIAHVVPQRMTATIGDRQFLETVTVVDPTFFEVIRLPLVQGDWATALSIPESIILSESVAKKYFGNSDPIGKVLTVSPSEGWACDKNDVACLNAVYPLTITGVLKDLPHNTHLVADLLMPNTSRADAITKESKAHGWKYTSGNYSYVKLLPGTDTQTVLSKLKPILDRMVIPDDPKVRGSELQEYRLTPFSRVHLVSDQYGGMQPPGSLVTIYGLSVIAFLIVLVACFNFMNLTTARATLRAREIAVRKVMGAKRSQLMIQFLSESVLSALFALVVALVIVEVSLPAYDAFLGRAIRFNYLADWPLSLSIVAGVTCAGLLSGVYPALVLSGFPPAITLKASVSPRTKSSLVRSLLVVGQFAVSTGLGVAAIVVFAQIHFVRNIDLGFRADGVVVIENLAKLTASARKSLMNALRANPAVVDTALSNAVPFHTFYTSIASISFLGEQQSVSARMVAIGPEFPSLYDIPLVAGRLMSASYGEDVTGKNILVNAKAVQQLGYSAEQAIGKSLTVVGRDRKRIVGVIGDPKLDGTKDAVLPAVYFYDPDNSTLLSIRISNGQVSETMAYIDTTWKSFAPNSAIKRYFMADAFESQFKSDERSGAMFAFFVGISLLIACLGLFGLAVFTAERRTKEIGLRKIFGGRTSNIVRLLLWQISIPVLVANAVAWPIAYYFLRNWLDGYAYRISLNPFYFLAVGFAALVIAWATVFVHALRLARASPILALRYE